MWRHALRIVYWFPDVTLLTTIRGLLLCQLNNATARQYPLDMRRTSNPFEYYESVPVISVVANGS